jgi:hypothetical protein
MTNLVKILGRFIAYTSEWIWIIILVLLFSIRTATIQTYITKLLADYLSKELNTEIKVKAVSIVYLDEIAFDGVLIKDKQADTLAYINTMYLSIDKFIPNHILSINEINIQGGIFNLKKKSNQLNIQFIVDYFSKENKKGKKSIKTIVDKIHLTNVKFDYNDDDYQKKQFGIDYNHISIENLQLDLDRVIIENNINKAFIKSCSFDEKRSGLKLKNLTCQTSISPKGIYTRRLNIQTNKSNIYAPYFELHTRTYKDLNHFNSSVEFKGNLFESTVNLTDISLFFPELEGMKNNLQIKGKVSKKVENLKIEDLDLKLGKETHIKGDINLPDFYRFSSSFLSERLDYIHLNFSDLEGLKLPKSIAEYEVKVSPLIKRLGAIDAYNVRLDGYPNEFVISAKKIDSKLGSIELNNGILFSKTIDHIYTFEQSSASEYDVKINQFDLGTLIQNKSIGKIDGIFFLSGFTENFTTIDFSNIEGNLNHFDFEGYPYKNITLTEGSLVNKIFTSKIDINDDNLALKYDGFIDFNDGNRLLMSIDLSKAILDNLNIGLNKESSLTSKFNLDLKGNDFNSLKGTIKLEGLIYQEKNKIYKLPELSIYISRSEPIDKLEVTSNLGTLKVNGKIDFNTIVSELQLHLSNLLPNILELKTNQQNLNSKNEFNYEITFNEVNKLLDVVYPDLKIAPSTTLKGVYSSLKKESNFSLTSNKISYKNIIASNVSINNKLSHNSIESSYSIADFRLNDSIRVNNLILNIQGNNDKLNSTLTWLNAVKNNSQLTWSTEILGIDEFKFEIQESFIGLQIKKWEINQNALIHVKNTTIDINRLKLKHQNQFIQLNGIISESDQDQVNFNINEFNLEDFGYLLIKDKNLKGIVNGWGHISNPYTNLSYEGDVNISDLYIDKREVGDLFMKSSWKRGSESLVLRGDLLYKSNKTFKFNGNYFLNRSENSLDFNLIFDNTDIRFTNAFFDPSIFSNIEGNILGKLKVSGEFDSPKIEGKVRLIEGNAKFALLNVNYGLEGEIISDKYGFYINNMFIKDEEGNTGSVVASAYHEKFSNWNYDIVLNLEDDVQKNKNAPTIVKPLNRFLVMNTSYDKENIYYGKGYGTGMVNIFGDNNIIDINVDLKTRSGSKIYFPFYTVSELNEEQNFIQFKTKHEEKIDVKPKIDFTGINMKLNFNITPEADIKLILDETTNDEITATGSGDITVALDKYNHLTLDGTFKVKKGDYNFVMRPINENFVIQENGTVTWTGDPYNALIDLKCYYQVNASLNEISQNLSTNNMGNQEILCYLNLTQSLLKPTIDFDIVAPNTNEAGQTLLNLIKNDNDMLNRQFFSLLLFKKFQSIDPQNSTSGGTSSAALDLAQSQINSMLSQVSKDYKLNVALDKNALTGGNSMAVGITKGFYGNRLIFKGSVGIGTTGAQTSTTTTPNQNPLIGDMNLEYSLNESGTFKVNIFNESNQNTILNNQLGLFTQGAGLQYQEDFTSLEEFKALQYLLDVFRSKEHKKMPVRKSNKQTPITSGNNQIILPKLDEE